MLAAQGLGILTGAGASFAPPASLPTVTMLRPQVLDVCREATKAVTGIKASREAIALEDGWSLEYTVGRIRACVGEVGLGVLDTMVLSLPNEAHMLLALHLAHGGLQVSLNFDQGVEFAYGLLTGRWTLPAAASAAFHDALAEYRYLLPLTPAPLFIARTDEEFATWVAAGRPPALLKIHGSIDQLDGPMRYLDPVVEDELELQQLSADRLAALDALADLDRVVVTGYSGKDIDVFHPLLDRLRPGSFRWAVLGLPDGKQEVRDIVARAGGEFVDGAMGSAVAALRDALDVPRTLLAWPTDEIGSDWQGRFAQWRERMLRDHLTELAVAYPWMLFDVGHFDEAVHALVQLGAQEHADPLVEVRLADSLYHRNRRRDRTRALRGFMGVLRSTAAPRPLRLYALIRIGEVFRSGGFPALLGMPLAWATARLALHMGERTRPVPSSGDWGERSMVGLAHSTLGHLGLRFAERVLSSRRRWRPAARWLLVRVCQVSLAHQQQAIALSGGNRGTFARQQLSETQALLALLAGDGIQPREVTTLERIRNSYEQMPDHRGAANATAALALWRAADGDHQGALDLLAEAFDRYRRQDGSHDPSGAALVARRRALIDAWVPPVEGVNHPSN